MTLASDFFNYSIRFSLELGHRRRVPRAFLLRDRTMRLYRREMLLQHVEREREDTGNRYRLNRQ